MMKKKEAHPSLENLVEGENLGFEILHPGGLEITQELAELCAIQRATYVLDVASGTGETACYLAEKLLAQVVGIGGDLCLVNETASQDTLGATAHVSSRPLRPSGSFKAI